MPKKVLVADDSVVIQKSIGITFAQEDFDVKFVGNGEDALSSCAEFGPDIILADVTMPKLGGVDLTKKLKEADQTKSIPVLLLAGARDKMDTAQAQACGALDVVFKPFDSNDLLEKVNQTMSQTPTTAAAPSQEPSPSIDLGGIDLDVDTPSPEISTDDAITSGFKPFSMDDGPSLDLDEMPADAFSVEPASATPPAHDVLKTEVAFKEDLDPITPAASPDFDFSMDATPDVEHEDLSSFSTPVDSQTIEPIAMQEPIAAASPTPAEGTGNMQLSDERIENIVTRVFQNVIERIAWEVVPDLAERIIREEIQRLTSENEGNN